MHVTPGRLLATTAAFLVCTMPAIPALAQVPSFGAAFQPATIGPGSVSVLTFTITNPSATPVTDLAFANTLPAGVTVAPFGNVNVTCADGVVSGGADITLSSGRLAGGSSCSISVNVTASAPGTAQNVSGDLTSSAGNSGAATADLTVDTERPGFSLAFSPDNVAFQATTTLTFTIDNTAGSSLLTSIAFVADLPSAFTIASPANAQTTCEQLQPAVLDATPGSSRVALSQGSMAAASFCTVAVDVIAASVGTTGLTTSELTAVTGLSQINSGRSAGTLTVRPVDPINLGAFFVGDPVAPGGTLTLAFTITNYDRNFPATDIAFTDDLSAALSGMVRLGGTISDVCGPGSQLSGTSLLTLTSGALPAGGTCTFNVQLQIPAATTPGTYVLTSSSITATVDGRTRTGQPATDSFEVAEALTWSMAFVPAQAASGDTVVLQFDLGNLSAVSSASGIQFSDTLAQFIPGVTATLPGPDVCGAGSAISLVSAAPDTYAFQLTGGALAPLGTCTFSVPLQLPTGLPPGARVNRTSPLQATIGGAPWTGAPSQATLTVLNAPGLSKQFLGGPAVAGGTVTVEYTLALTGNAPGPATGISFTDDLDSALSGLAAMGTPLADPCGTGSLVTGTSVLTLTRGTVAPDEACTFQVTLAVPAAAPSGAVVSRTSNVAATMLATPVLNVGAEATFTVGGLMMTMAFTDDPVLAGDNATVQYTVFNLDAAQAATDIAFTHDLAQTLAGLTATGLPTTDVCGAGSSLSGAAAVTLAGASLPPGGSCTFTATLLLPGNAQAESYASATGALTATVAGLGVAVPGGRDSLQVGELLQFSALFTDDPVAIGSTATLEFTIRNNSSTATVADLAFTDDLAAALGGLVATGLPANDVCGAGSVLSGTTTLALTGGTLAPQTTCTFSTLLQLPANVFPSAPVVNSVADLMGTLAGLPVQGAVASDGLQIDVARLTKVFAAAQTGGPTTVTYTLENLSTAELGGLAFSEDLDAVVAGLLAVGLPTGDACGTGSLVSGTNLVTLTAGNLGGNGMCTFVVNLQVPASASQPSYVSTSSVVSSDGLRVGQGAQATLSVQAPPLPVFTKAFSPNSIAWRGTSTLALTIDNTGATVTAADAAFTDQLPAGMAVAAAPNASTTCVGGTLTADPGATVVSLTGAQVSAASVCTVQVSITSNAVGMLVNVTGNLSTSLGASTPATATLTVTPVDADGDGVFDHLDADPANPNVCRDTDNDTCDDCALTGANGSGGDPSNDGPDPDGDGICNPAMGNDGGAVTDSGITPDASAMADGGAALDAGTTTDAATPTGDAGNLPAGDGNDDDSGQCGCHVAGSPGGGQWLLLGLLAATAGRNRRRTPRRTHKRRG